MAARWILIAGIVSLIGSSPVYGGFEARVSVEMEYQGENYRNESVIDLPSPDDVSERLVEVTKFTADTWLPGNRIEFLLSPTTPWNLNFRSSTGFNARRFYQELDGRLNIPTTNGYWYLRAFGALREESQSFVGHGDWHTGFEAKRQSNLNKDWAGRFEMRYRRSRTRGDTLNFVYDYDRADATLRLLKSGTGRSLWETYATGTLKSVPEDGAGSYGQLALGALFRPPLGRRLYFAAEVRQRNYDQDGEIGRDFFEVDISGRGAVISGASYSVLAEVEFLGADYKDNDDLYYDFSQMSVFVPWEHRGSVWTTLLGPRARLLWDADGGTRNYRQLSFRGEATRPLGFFGFGQFSLEAGYRDYRTDTAAVEIDLLSTTLLRSDYWLFDFMILANAPLGGPFSVEVLADTALEMHEHESERIHVTFMNLAITTTF